MRNQMSGVSERVRKRRYIREAGNSSKRVSIRKGIITLEGREWKSIPVIKKKNARLSGTNIDKRKGKKKLEYKC